MIQICCSELPSVRAAQARLELAAPVVYDDRLGIAERIHHEEAAVGSDIPARMNVSRHVITLEELLPIRDVHATNRQKLFEGEYVTGDVHASWDVAPDGRFLVVNPLRNTQTIVMHDWRGELEARVRGAH
jgi:hypothetical protein